MTGFGSDYLNRRYDAWRTMSDEDYYDSCSFFRGADEDEPDHERGE